MPTRFDIPSSADDHAAIARRSSRMLTACGILMISILALLTLQRTSDGKTREQPRAMACARWDDMASEAIAVLAQNKPLLGEARFRLRRARSNCRAGWIGPACEDYRAIIEQAPERKMSWSADASSCASTLARAGAGSRRQARRLELR